MIIVLLVVLKPMFDGPDQMYAYAIGVLVGTAVQFAMALPVLRQSTSGSSSRSTCATRAAARARS